MLTLGAVDSSPLVVPLGNDLLVLALSARYHDRMLYYAVMATLGSLIGCFATDWISRKGGARLKKVAPGERLGNIQSLVRSGPGGCLWRRRSCRRHFPLRRLWRLPRRSIIRERNF